MGPRPAVVCDEIGCRVNLRRVDSHERQEPASMCGIDGCVASGSRIDDEIGLGSKIALKPRAQRSRCECDNGPITGEGTIFQLQKKTAVWLGNTRNGEGRRAFRQL